MTQDRRQSARRARIEAAEMAHARTHPEHKANGDEQRLASAHYLMSFTKGLDHDKSTGLVKDKTDFEAFRNCIDNGFIEQFTTRVPVPESPKFDRRKWEAPTAGMAFDLEGPDAQAVTMPPAPALGSDELAYEMAEVYELALLRDVPFNTFDNVAGGVSTKLTASIKRLNDLPYAKAGYQGRPRKSDNANKITKQTAFRGSAPGVEKGPYLSQFLIVGNKDQSGADNTATGLINFGAQQIDQKVLAAKDKTDYMVKWDDWHNVQQGYDVNKASSIPSGQEFPGPRRPIYTPRDLATYVHYDQLYQAYLNACLIMLSNGIPTDPGFDGLSGSSGARIKTDTSSSGRPELNAGGFALYGGPHILTLVTEVATRALKAVRYQKFNNHIRARPEVLAARIAKFDVLSSKFPTLCETLNDLCAMIDKTLEAVNDHNPTDSTLPKGNFLLPTAFQEGSPMHPAYGAGHATVAGACVTVLKAFFDTSAIFGINEDGDTGFFAAAKVKKHIQFDVIKDGHDFKLDPKPAKCPLTLEGELNKLAANISIGRNMAGVHYFSDYYDSLRMGEEIAIGMLQEQAVCYPTDPFVMSVPTFDGDVVRIGRR